MFPGLRWVQQASWIGYLDVMNARRGSADDTWRDRVRGGIIGLAVGDAVRTTSSGLWGQISAMPLQIDEIATGSFKRVNRLSKQWIQLL